MLKAFGRLGLITVGSLILAILAVVFVRQLGQMQAFAEPPHPWFQNPKWSIFTPKLEDVCDTPKFKPDPGWLVQIPVKYIDEKWQVPCPVKPLPLNELFSESQHTNWILKPEAIDTTYLDRLVETVGLFDKNKRFAVASHSQRVARYLRKKAPQWLFAADDATLVRLQMFESIWLETALDFWPDFVITPNSDAELRPRAARELERRRKRIVWDADKSTLEPEYPFHGIMTTRPSEIERFELPK